MIDIVLSDDWELRGDGSGNMRRIQFDTLQRLIELYERYGFRGSFNVEVMQQLAHRRLAGKEPELGKLAMEWEKCVLDAYGRGHDIQLHIHPQWSKAEYQNSRWVLRGDWNICNYRREAIDSMVSVCKGYLEGLIGQIDPEYRCSAFRSGSWCAAPSPHLFPVLIENGIVFDMSLVDGLFYDLEVVKLDYRALEEGFLPYFPLLSDGRLVGPSESGIICCPTFSFRSHRAAFWRLAAPILQRLPGFRVEGALRAASSYRIAQSNTVEDYSSIWKPSKRSRLIWLKDNVSMILTGRHVIADIAQLSPVVLDLMLAQIRRRTRKRGLETTLVILENHTKDIGNFAPIEHFCRRLADARSWCRVIRASEAARNLKAGRYKIACNNARAN